MMRSDGVPGPGMDELVGRTLGPYELLDRIGTGGMATVYRGVHRALGQPRAIKILQPALATDTSLVERFRAEAKIASGLRHPNIVSIYDVGEQDGLFYLVMDLVEGVPLGRLLRRDRMLDLDRAMRLLRQLASALDYAHARGILHRDIKASNVLVGEDDQVSLFDFGIARASAALARITIPGQVVGTPEYLAPEVITGAEGDQRADFYALGILAYQMLAGRLPFAGDDTMALLYAQVSKQPPSLREIRPNLPVAVERVVLRQLAKAPEDRYPTAEDFVGALSDAAVGGTGDGPGAPATVRPPALRQHWTPAPGVEDPARRTAPGVDGSRTTPLPQLRSQAEQEIATPRPTARPVGFDPSVSTIPPEPVYQPGLTRRPDPSRRPEPRSTPPGGLAAADRSGSSRLPVQRAELAVRRQPAVRVVDPEPPSRRGPGLGPIAVVALGLVGIWALATGRLESLVGTIVGVEATPTVVLSTRPEPTVASIVTDPTATVLAAAAQAATVPPVTLAVTPAAAVAPPVVAVAPTPTIVPTLPPEPTAMPVAQAAVVPPSPEQQFQRALQQIDEGSFASAVPLLGELKASAPNTEGLDDALYRAHLGLGQQQLDQGLLDDSYAAFGEALKLRADDPAALEGQKQVVLTKLWNTMETAWGQDDAVATAALEEILALDPGYRDADVKLYALLVTQANRMLGEGDVDGALVVLRRAQDVYPEGEEAPALIAAHTPPPEPEPAPAQNQAPAPAPAPKPAPKPAQKPVPPSQKPSLPSLPGLPGLPPLPRP